MRRLVAMAARLLLFARELPATARSKSQRAIRREADPATALTDALVAACRANETRIRESPDGDNGAAFRALPEPQRSALMKRLSLSDSAGKPLLSADAQNHIVLRCRRRNNTVEYRFGTPRVHENLAFIPVAVVNSDQADFGMVREAGSWRLLSLGLVLFDVPQLAKQWAAADLAAHEERLWPPLRALAEAIQTYRRAFGKLPESLAQNSVRRPKIKFRRSKRRWCRPISRPENMTATFFAIELRPTQMEMTTISNWRPLPKLTESGAAFFFHGHRGKSSRRRQARSCQHLGRSSDCRRKDRTKSQRDIRRPQV